MDSILKNICEGILRPGDRFKPVLERYRKKQGEESKKNQAFLEKLLDEAWWKMERNVLI